MKKKMKKISYIALLIIIGVIFTRNISFVNASDELIKVGNLTVTIDTTIDDIEKVLGKAKIKTISPFGGYAYTFYTDDNYDNYLYIETTADDKIISYGSVDDSYSVPIEGKNNGSNYVEDETELSGEFYTDDKNQIVGGIYYNKSALYDGDTEEIRRLYNSNYDDYYIEYQYGISKHAVTMFNALAKRLGKDINVKYDDNLYEAVALDETRKLKNGYSSYDVLNLISSFIYYNDYDYNYDNYDNYVENYLYRLKYEQNVIFSDMTSYVLNPMFFASMLKNNENKDYKQNNKAFFYYDKKEKNLYGAILPENYKELNVNGNNHYNGEVDNSQIMYAINLLDDKMSEKEKALILAQYVLEGKYNLTTDEETKPEKEANISFRKLANIAGLSCRYLYGEPPLNICKLDGKWTYIDASKERAQSFDPKPYAQVTPKLVFKSLSTIKSDSSFSNYKFDDLKDYDNTFDDYGYESIFHTLPDGEDIEIDNYSSRIYYDDNYKYYEKTENKGTKLYKENRDTGSKEVLSDVLYDRFGTGLVKENDLLYYVGTDYSLYSLNLKNNEKKVEITSDSNNKVRSVYLNNDGVICYFTFKDEAKALKKHSNWPKERLYIPNDNNYKYKINYLETKENIVLLGIDGFGSKKAKGKDDMAYTFQNKPIVGIMGYSGDIVSNFKAPKDLLYIGDSVFSNSYNNNNYDIQSIEFNDKLKYIGDSAFYGNSKIEELIIPDSVSYIGSNAFKDLSNVKTLKLSSNLTFINDSSFYKIGVKKTIVPEGVEYIAINAFYAFSDSRNAIILPSTLKFIGRYNLFSSNEIFIKSKNIEFMDDIYYSEYLYLPKDSQTSQYADEHNIKYIPVEDFDHLKQTVTLEYPGYISEDHKIDLKIGSFNMTYNVRPQYYYDDETTLTWSSSETDVATVDQDGLVTLHNPGTTKIKLTTSHGGEGEYEITVKGLNMNYKEYQFTSLDQKLTLTASYDGRNASVSWSSSNSEIAEVDQKGVVTPKRGGFATISAVSSGYGTAKCLVYIQLPIELSDGSKAYAGDLNKDGVIDDNDVTLLESYVEQGNVDNDQLLLGDINGDGTVDSSDVEKLKSIKTNSTFQVGAYKHINRVILDHDELHLKTKSTGKLTATIDPKDTTDSKTLTFTSSNKKVATVDNSGNITTIGDGITTITVKTSNGKQAKCKVTVGTGIGNYLKGDLTHDNFVDVKDSRDVLYMAVGKKTINYEDFDIADMNKNKMIDAGDAIEILRIYLQKE